MFDYQFKTTFWTDFSIADVFGVSAIKDTFNRAFEEWRDNYIYITELVLVLNWKLWEHYDKDNMTFAQIYNDFYREAYSYGYEHLEGDELKYFFDTLD